MGSGRLDVLDVGCGHRAEFAGRVALFRPPADVFGVRADAGKVDHVGDDRRGFHKRGQAAFRLVLRVFLDRFTRIHHQHDRPTGEIFAHRDGRQNRDDHQHVDADVAFADVVDHTFERIEYGVYDQRDHDPLAERGVHTPEEMLPRVRIPQQCHGDRRDHGDGKHRHESACLEEFGKE